MSFPLNRLLVVCGILLFVIYLAYALLSTAATGNVNPAVAWGLAYSALGLFVAGLLTAILRRNKPSTMNINFKKHDYSGAPTQFVEARKSGQIVTPAKPINPTKPLNWWRVLAFLVAAIAILYISLIVYSILSGHFFDGYQF